MLTRCCLDRPFLWVTLSVLAGVFLLNGKVTAEPRPRETWHAYVADGQRFGSEHVTVAKGPGDNFRYMVESRTLIDLFGSQRQELLNQTEYVVTADYKPVSVRVRRKTESGDTLIVGSTNNGELRLRFERGELSWTRSIAVRGKVVLSACLDDFLNDHTQGTVQKRVEFTLLDTDGWYAHKATAIRQEEQASGHVWTVDLGTELGRGTISFGQDGIRRETKFRVPPVRMVSCSEDEAADLHYRKLVGRDVLMFPLSKDIGHPDRLRTLKVRLTWKDVPFDDLILEDKRQQIVEKTDGTETNAATLVITAPKPVDDPLKFPIDDARFAPYLAATRYIKPDDEAIERQARQWIGQSPDSLAAVRALSREISNYLNGGSLIAETLSGPEVLHLKEGKCSEYATLFASLSRSIGIPARIVLGERLVGGYWVGHMWNEAYVGEWITVDSTANEVGSSFSLIKFVHSDTVMGTQKVRFGLTDSLAITVEDFEQSSPLTTKLKTGVEGKQYTNIDYTCRLTAPRDDWMLVDKSQAGVATVRFKVPDEDVLIHFVAFTLPTKLSPRILVVPRRARFTAMYTDFKVLKSEKFEIGGVKGQLFAFQRAPNAKETGTIKTTEFIWTEEKAGYLLNLIASESTHDKYFADVEKLLHSFEQLDLSH